jgi:hypothetical protein
MTNYTTDNVRGKTLRDLEKEEHIQDELTDISERYVGLPRHKKFYRESEVNFADMRARFNAMLRRLGFKSKA